MSEEQLFRTDVFEHSEKTALRPRVAEHPAIIKEHPRLNF